MYVGRRVPRAQVRRRDRRRVRPHRHLPRGSRHRSVRLLRARGLGHRPGTARPTACSTTTTRVEFPTTPRWRTCRSRRPTSTSTPCSTPTTRPRTAGSWRPPPPGPRTRSTTPSTTTCNYLRAGQLGRPDLSLDRSYINGNHYGNWIFFRYLTEKYRASAGGMPTLVRDMWSRADGSAAGRTSSPSRPWSTPSRPPAATSPRCTPGSPTPTAARGRRTPRARRSGTRPRRWPSAPSSSRPQAPRTTWGAVRLDHLSSAQRELHPEEDDAEEVEAQGAGRHGRPLPRLGRGGQCLLQERQGDAAASSRSTRKGKGAKAVAFSSRKVSRVELVLVNASTRGSADNRLTQKLRASAFR